MFFLFLFNTQLKLRCKFEIQHQIGVTLFESLSEDVCFETAVKLVSGNRDFSINMALNVEKVAHIRVYWAFYFDIAFGSFFYFYFFPGSLCGALLLI